MLFMYSVIFWIGALINLLLFCMRVAIAFVKKIPLFIVFIFLIGVLGTIFENPAGSLFVYVGLFIFGGIVIYFLGFIVKYIVLMSVYVGTVIENVFSTLSVLVAQKMCTFALNKIICMSESTYTIFLGKIYGVCFQESNTLKLILPLGLTIVCVLIGACFLAKYNWSLNHVFYILSGTELYGSTNQVISYEMENNIINGLIFIFLGVCGYMTGNEINEN